MHMSNFKINFVDVMLHKGFVFVIDSYYYAVKDINTVELKMLLPNSFVKPAILIKIFYISAIKNTRLFN